MDNSSDGGGTSDGFMAGELLAEERGIAKSRAVERLGSYDILLQQRRRLESRSRVATVVFHRRPSTDVDGAVSVLVYTRALAMRIRRSTLTSPTDVQPRRRVTSPTVFRSDDFCSFPPGSPLAR